MNNLKDALNAIREETVKEGKVYHQYVPYITDTTSITEFGQPILNNPEVYNEFCNKLIKRIVFAGINTKTFNNPLQQLEGDQLPLGYAGQEIYVNPVKPRQFNVKDFAGLLQEYQADVKVQYINVNSDLQYPLTITRDKLRTAFLSWDNLNSFVDGLINAVYNGAYITRYNQAKMLVSNAYRENAAQIVTVPALDGTAATARNFIKAARTYALNFRSPSDAYNAWKKVGGYGNAVVTWSNPEDIRFILRNDVLSTVDVEVLARAFNMDEASFIGRVIGVDSFDIYNDEGEKIFDGSNIYGIMADKDWFRIRTQEFVMDGDFYNPNNRTRQYYLNDTRVVAYSLFANAVIFATEQPSVEATSASFNPATITVKVGEKKEVAFNVTPFQSTGEVAYASEADGTATATASETNPRVVVVEGVAEGNTVITGTIGDLTAKLAVIVEA